MFRTFRASQDSAPLILLISVLALLLTACGGSSDEPAATVPAQAAQSTPTIETIPPSPTPEPEPTATSTATPEQEPTATPMRTLPAPTVAAPLYQPPTPIPTAATEPTPEIDLPEDDSGTEELLLISDLTDRDEGDLDIGRGFVGDGAYHIYNASNEGLEIYSRYDGLDFGDVLVSIDVRMVSDSLNAFACLMSRADPFEWNYGYTFCINGYSETFGEFEYVDENGERQFERLIDFDVRESTLPANEWNTLSIISIGEDFGFFVNDELIGVAVHSGPPSGSVAFFVYNYDESPTEWQFTNLMVWSAE
jgi:hypothetical protein